ncbi:O-antigen polymerase [Clostridium perfringens]|uniref:O-antigen polymerase n=1 Tax=Clostridium perfringens TaxID=1502 RepID=UPI0039ECC873
MNYIGIAFCITMIAIGFITNKKIINPITIFYTLWAVIFELSFLRLFNLKQASDKAYQIILLGLFTFAIGYYLVYFFTRKYKVVLRYHKHFKRKIFKKEYLLRYKLIYFLGVITFLIYLYDLSIIFSYILNGSSLAYIRQLAQDSTSIIYANRSVVENAIRVLIVTPFTIALQPIVAVDFWFGERNKKLIIMDVSIIILRVITDGSRVLIVYLLLHFLASLTFINRNFLKSRKREKKKKRKKKLIITLIVVVSLFALYKTTLSRSGENFLRYLYYYFSMEPYMFEIWSEVVDSTQLVGYGFASTNGFWFFLFYIIKNILGLSKYPEHWYSIYNIILATDSHWQVIAGDATTANAYVSLFWFFYLDGKIIGVIIGMLIYGMVCSKMFSNALNKKTSKSICLYLIILQGLCFSFVRLQFADIYYSIAVIFILLFAYKPTVLRIGEDIKQID